MSTTAPNHIPLNAVDEDHRHDESRLAPYSPAKTDQVEDHCVIQYENFSRLRPTTRNQNPRVLRRLRGFLVEHNGLEARVAFVENGETILYELPADQLRRSGVLVKNQPFEMDEVEIKSEDGLIIGYRFRPLAKPSDARIEPLEINDERRRKRDAIFKAFGKPAD